MGLGHFGWLFGLRRGARCGVRCGVRCGEAVAGNLILTTSNVTRFRPKSSPAWAKSGSLPGPNRLPESLVFRKLLGCLAAA